MFWPGRCRRLWRKSFVWRCCETRFGSRGRRFSTRIKGCSSPVRSLRGFWKGRGSESAWTAAAGSTTKSSSSVFGARSSTKRSIFTNIGRSPRRGRISERTFGSTTKSGSTKGMAIGRRKRWTSRSAFPGRMEKSFFTRSSEKWLLETEMDKMVTTAGCYYTLFRPSRCPDNGVHPNGLVGRQFVAQDQDFPE